MLVVVHGFGGGRLTVKKTKRLYCLFQKLKIQIENLLKSVIIYIFGNCRVCLPNFPKLIN